MDLDPGTVAALQTEQRQFSPFNCGNSAFLIYSILSLERAMRERDLISSPQLRGGEREADSVGRRLGGQRISQIFLETWELSKPLLGPETVLF